MSRWIDADAFIDDLYEHEFSNWCDKDEVSTLVNDAPSIDLDDYVPKEFHDKTCEAMAQRHQEEIANMASIVRCWQCKYKSINDDGETRYYYCALEDRPNRQWSVDEIDYCSWGERRA